MSYKLILSLLDRCRQAFNELPNKSIVIDGEKTNTYALASELTKEVNNLKKSTFIVWGIDDVIQQAKDDEVEITEEQALTVLEYLRDSHDANEGINWGVISGVIQLVIKVDQVSEMDKDLMKVFRKDSPAIFVVKDKEGLLTLRGNYSHIEECTQTLFHFEDDSKKEWTPEELAQAFINEGYTITAEMPDLDDKLFSIKDKSGRGGSATHTLRKMLDLHFDYEESYSGENITEWLKKCSTGQEWESRTAKIICL